MALDLFRLHPPSSDDELANEPNQTRQRLVILTIISAYLLLLATVFNSFALDAKGPQTILAYYGFYTPAALFLYWAARRWPGHYPARRLGAMVLDYGSLAFSIVVERVVMMPLFMVIVWITVGNAMRYGRPYLNVAQVFAIVTLAGIFALIPWTDQTPFFMVMLILTTIAVPRYAFWLKEQGDIARREAEAANLAKSRMLAQASHDLRQPIHATSLLIHSLQQSGLDLKQREIVERIDRSLRGVARLFRSLLDLSTLDSGSIKPNPEPVQVGELLEELVLQNLQQAEWNGTDLRMVDTSAIVIADRTLLTTMVQNLLSNALKFAPGRAVLVGCRPRGQTVSIEVWDQGIGIAPENQRQIFDEFVQVRRLGDRDTQGAGLGLSIVKRMADLMGLTVSLKSEPGKGSRFAIADLPRHHGTGRTIETPARAVQDWSPLVGMRVLLVEDDEDVLVATADLLRSWQCQVDSYLGLPAYRQNCDVIVTDFDLGGGITGADVIAAIREDLGTETPAIVITGHDGDHITTEIADSAIPVLRKPIRPAELRSALLSVRF